VQPKYALISAGYLNRYGHPATEVLDRYNGLKIPTLNTVSCGAIMFEFANKNKLRPPKCYRIASKRFWFANYIDRA